MVHRLDPFGLVGTIVDGRYRIECVAGEGGYGIVYRSSQVALGVPLALKVLRSGGKRYLSRESSAPVHVPDLKMEAQLLFRMCSLHPSFVQAKDAGQLLTAQGTAAAYLVLEWLNGAPLATEIRARRARGLAFPLSELIQLLDAPARGLAIAHARGISHRDLKPGNLFLANCEGNTAVKILDFGLAKVQCGSGTTSQFAHDELEPRAFTAAYAAPEQWLQRLGATGTWTDVYAWALLCTELLVGRPALNGICEEQLMAACLDASMRPTPRALGASVSLEVDGVFARALSVDPRQRFRDVGIFWESLLAAAKIPRPDGAAELISELGSNRPPPSSLPNIDPAAGDPEKSGASRQLCEPLTCATAVTAKHSPRKPKRLGVIWSWPPMLALALLCPNSLNSAALTLASASNAVEAHGTRLSKTHPSEWSDRAGVRVVEATPIAPLPPVVAAMTAHPPRPSAGLPQAIAIKARPRPAESRSRVSTSNAVTEPSTVREIEPRSNARSETEIDRLLDSAAFSLRK